MRVIHQTVQVIYHYPVYFTADLFAIQNQQLRDVLQGEYPKVLFVVERAITVAFPELLDAITRYSEAHADAMHMVCSPMMVEGGERIKHDEAAVSSIQAAICHYGICRHSYVIAIGGGALLDAVGYAVAIAHRGVRLIRVPTTVLAQNDSGVGVKNGINAFGRKNFLGTFTPPAAVINDATFLTSLPLREWRSGIAEAVKVALLKDSAFFAAIERDTTLLLQRDLPAMERLIFRCAQLHLEHIATSGDPFEFGSSRPLDYGHWAAHKLEHLTDYRLRHGEAVAIGIALDATYASLVGLLTEKDCQRIIHLLLVLGFNLFVPELSDHLDERQNPRCVLSGLDEFREHLGGDLTVALLTAIGQFIDVHEIDEAIMKESIVRLKSYGVTTEEIA